MIEILQKIDNYINHIKTHRDIEFYRFIKYIRDEMALDREFDNIIKEYDIYEFVDAVSFTVKRLTIDNNIGYINDYFKLNDAYIYMELHSGATVSYYPNIKHKKFVLKDECFTYEISPNLTITKPIKKKWNEIKEEMIELLHDVLVDMAYLV